MNSKTIMAAIAAVACAGTALADFNIAIDVNSKPMKDMRDAKCVTGIGFNAALESVWSAGGGDDWWFVSNKVSTARVLKEAGVSLMRLQCMNGWFARRNDEDPKVRSNPGAAFSFWKANGMKVFVCLECPSKEAVDANVEIVKWLVDNDFKGVVAGFELGNETYGNPRYASLAPFWTEFINRSEKIWPKIPLGINIGELFENNPDIVHMKNRLLSNEDLKRDWTFAGAYFTAANFNKYTAQFVMAMSNSLDKISHIVYHAYGAESPYSCSYYGFQRFRNFTEMFPVLKSKKYWLTEIRPRSDEDNHCQRMFRESLIMAHYSLMALCQPETDCFNHHQLTGLSGAIYQSSGSSWYVQWYDGTQNEYPDFRAPYGQPHIEVGSCGVMYRILSEGIRECPIFLHHGTSKATDNEDAYFTSARLTDEVYTRRRAIKEGKDEEDAPKVNGEVEWVAAVNPGKNQLCLLMVNSKSTAEKIKLTVPGKELAAPTYRTLTCPEEFLDCREVPGDGKPWKQASWEDTQHGYGNVAMEMYKGMKPKADSLTIRIKPHTVQTVTLMMRNAPKPKTEKK